MEEIVKILDAFGNHEKTLTLAKSAAIKLKVILESHLNHNLWVETIRPSKDGGKKYIAYIPHPQMELWARDYEGESRIALHDRWLEEKRSGGLESRYVKIKLSRFLSKNNTVFRMDGIPIFGEGEMRQWADSIGESPVFAEDDGGFSMHIVKGRRVEETYQEKYFSSCMHGAENALEFYVHNSEFVSCIRIMKGGELAGRALLWNLPDGRKAVDRIYPSDGGLHIDFLKEIAKQKGWLYKKEQSVNRPFYDPEGEQVSLSITGLKYFQGDGMPYMDTFHYGNYDWSNNQWTLYTANHSDSRKAEYEFDSTDETCPLHDEDSRRCEGCGHRADEFIIPIDGNGNYNYEDEMCRECGEETFIFVNIHSLYDTGPHWVYPCDVTDLSAEYYDRTSYYGGQQSWHAYDINEGDHVVIEDQYHELILGEDAMTCHHTGNTYHQSEMVECLVTNETYHKDYAVYSAILGGYIFKDPDEYIPDWNIEEEENCEEAA